MALATYAILNVAIPLGFPILVALIFCRIKGIAFQPHILLGGGQLFFYAITVSLANISQIASVQHHEAVKASTDFGLGFIVLLSACLWAFGMGEVLSPSPKSDEIRRGVTRYSFFLGIAAALLGGIFRSLADLF